MHNILQLDQFKSVDTTHKINRTIVIPKFVGPPNERPLKHLPTGLHSAIIRFALHHTRLQSGDHMFKCAIFAYMQSVYKRFGYIFMCAGVQCASVVVVVGLCLIIK